MKLPDGVLSRVVVSRIKGSNEVGNEVAPGSFRLVLSKKLTSGFLPGLICGDCPDAALASL